MSSVLKSPRALGIRLEVLISRNSDRVAAQFIPESSSVSIGGSDILSDQNAKKNDNHAKQPSVHHCPEPQILRHAAQRTAVVS